MKKQRSDADRRIRQCERLGRLLRMLHLIMGKGRWDATTLAEELGCSRRTVYRLLQTLSMAGVPWYFDESTRCYRVRAGYRFAAILESTHVDAPKQIPNLSLSTASLVAELESVLRSLKEFQRHFPPTDR